MRILVVYPGHATSTVDVAIGWENTLKKLGHDVKAFRYHDALAFYQKALQWWGRHNKQFTYNDDQPLYMASTRAVAEVVQDAPQVILIVTGTAMHKEFYACMKRLGMPMALIMTESPYADLLQYDMCKAVEFDAVFVNDKASVLKFADFGGVYLPHSYDPARHYPRQTDKKCDVFFVGTMYPERKKLLRACNWEGLDAKIVGPALTKHGGNVAMGIKRRLTNEEAAEWYAGAKVCLSLNRTVMGSCLNGLMNIGEGDAWSLGPRSYEIAACGGFQIAEGGRGELKEVFGDSVPACANAKELEELTRFYVAHDEERQRMAQRQMAAVQPCTFQRRAEEIVLPVLEKLAGRRQ
jgi:spore maturation protein CgeB